MVAPRHSEPFPPLYAGEMEKVGEPEEIRIPREDDTPVLVPAEEPLPEEPQPEAEPVPG